MSRGFGKWQRLILETLAYRPWATVETILGSWYNHAEYTAVLRAANRLEELGEITIDRSGKTLKFCKR